MKKQNLVPLTRLNRNKLSQLRRISVRKLPKATQIDWASTIGKSLTKEAKDRAQSTLTSLAPYKETSQWTLHPCPHPLHLQLLQKITEHSKYCAICNPLGTICPEEFSMSSDMDKEEDQAKNKDNDQKQSQTNPSFSTAMIIAMMPPKPFITKYLDSMSSETPIMYTTKR